MAPSPLQRRLQLALVCACAALAFANTLANGFVWDDVLLVQSNPWLEGPQHLGDIFTTHFWGFASRADLSRNYYRPLVHVTLMLCRAAFGLKPWGSHLVMLLGHVAVSGLVYRVGLLFAGEHSSEGRPGGHLAALAGSLIVCFGHWLAWPDMPTAIAGAVLCFALRILAMWFNWRLPSAQRDGN